MALDLLQGCTRDQIGFLAQSGLPQESSIVLPGTIFYSWIRLRPPPRLEPGKTWESWCHLCPGVGGLHRSTQVVSFPSFGPGLSVESCAIPRQAY